MLTATYSLIALSVEQKKARCNLSELQHCIQKSSNELPETDRAALEAAFEKLARFDEECHKRKVELYLIPAVRKATHEADSLLQELGSLSMLEQSVLRSVRDRLGEALDQSVDLMEELRGSLELYCKNLLRRLALEDELLKIAQRVISGEDWFALAANFLSRDAEREKHKQSAYNMHLLTTSNSSMSS
jgi:hemerythrin-like domain-containing protein